MPDILIVDDDAGVRRALRRALECAGLHCRVAATGQAALARAADTWPDAVMLDLSLVGALDGWAAWAALSDLADGRTLRVVVLTGDQAALELALRRGAALALCKSEYAHTVALKVQRLLSGVNA